MNFFEIYLYDCAQRAIDELKKVQHSDKLIQNAINQRLNNAFGEIGIVQSYIDGSIPLPKPLESEINAVSQPGSSR